MFVRIIRLRPILSRIEAERNHDGEITSGNRPKRYWLWCVREHGLHPNTMKIVLLAGKETLYQQEYYSVGSGFIEWKRYKPPDKGKPKYPYATMKELMRHLGDNRISLPQLILANEMAISGKSEQQVWDFIDQVTNVMMGMVDTGLKSEGVLRHLYCSHGDDGERHEPEIQGDIGSWTRRPRTLLNGNFMKSRTRAAWVAWLLAAIYYFYQYALRSAPAVMMSQLSEAFDRSAAVVAGILGIFYYGYAALSLVAGTSIDRIGARTVVPAGALVTGAGALLFATGNLTAAGVGRLLQGGGGVFSLIGAIYIATRNFPGSQAATLIGATQMFGMAGGAAGQFLVGPMIARGMPWNVFWISMGVAGLAIATAVWVLLPTEKLEKSKDDWLKGSMKALGVVFRNPQSILWGLIAGLLFIPTTIFDMIWGVRFLQEAHGFSYGEAVIRSVTVPLGWIIGCPLLGLVSDRIGRRKPVIICGACVLLACISWILYGRANALPPYLVGLIAGLASGSAMLLYTVIKETNPPQYSGTATGAINLLNFTFTAIMGQVFVAIMQAASQGKPTGLQHYQVAFQPLLYGRAARVPEQTMVIA
jgi:MFS family permease